MVYVVEEVEADSTWDLRLRVLGNPSPGPADARAGTFHYAAYDATGRVVGVATAFEEATPFRQGRAAFRIRGMAVEPEVQGTGAGRLVLREVVARCRVEGAEVVWANGRDSALPFYERFGFLVIGEGFAEPNGIPHHVVLLEF